MTPDELRDALSSLVDDYAAWISEQKVRIGADILGFDDPGKDVIECCEEILSRLQEGMETLFTNLAALEAFRFANRSMARCGIYEPPPLAYQATPFTLTGIICSTLALK